MLFTFLSAYAEDFSHVFTDVLVRCYYNYGYVTVHCTILISVKNSAR